MILDKNFTTKTSYEFDDLVFIMKLLRGKNGCPWDAEQNHRTIRNNFIEEVYEAVDAIDTDNNELLREELGDVLLQVVFHSQISADEKVFNIDDVIDGICKKLIIRHPHVFGDLKVSDSNDVLENWDKIKRVEKSQKTGIETLLDVPKSLPALMRAQKLNKRAIKCGLLTIDKEAALDRLSDMVFDLKINIKEGTSPSDKILGSILMSVACISYLYGIDVEEALYKSCEQFIDFCKNATE